MLYVLAADDDWEGELKFGDGKLCPIVPSSDFCSYKSQLHGKLSIWDRCPQKLAHELHFPGSVNLQKDHFLA